MGTNCRALTKKKYSDSQLIIEKNSFAYQSNPKLCSYLLKLITNKQTNKLKMASADLIQSFETETTVTTFEMKTLEMTATTTTEEQEVVVEQQQQQEQEHQGAELAPVVEMRNKSPHVNAIEDGIRRHFGNNMVDLIYWKDIKKSAVVAASSLFLLISLSIFSVLSVI